MKISRRMLTQALSHHQVMPSFLEFVFPFGHQQYAEDFLFSGFRQDTRLRLSDGGLVVKDLGRSGREIRICYSLKSVERKEQNVGSPWSVRQTAVYHSLDIVTGKVCWIMVKGNNLIRDRVKFPDNLSSKDCSGSFGTVSESFASTLQTHLIMCDWADENWRWYLAFLEKDLQRLTRHALTIEIPKAHSFIEPKEYQEMKQPTKSIARTFSEMTKRKFTMAPHANSDSSTDNSQYQTPFPMAAVSLSLLKLPPNLPPGMGGSATEYKPDKDEIFSENTLQQVQVIEDKTNEVVLILEANIKIVKDIHRHYSKILCTDKCPHELRAGSIDSFGHFERRVENIVGDLEIQRSSAQTLLRLLENRKGIVSPLTFVQIFVLADIS